MVLARVSLPLIAGLVLASAFSSPAPARTNYDGNWSVLIMTEKGTCDRAYRYGLSIEDGAVLYKGSAAVRVDGRVSGNGRVNVRVSGGSQRASGYGRLSRNYGTGTWSGVSSSGVCSGSWTAERR